MTTVRRNRDILTGGKKYAQKQSKKYRVEEVVFDKDSRQEYLTGFHKRKLQRQKKAQEYNKEQERLARIEERRQIREERKKDLEKQLERFNETVKEITTFNDSDDEEKNEEGDEWVGFRDEELLIQAETDKQDDDEINGSTGVAKKVKGILQHKEIYTIDKTTELLPESGAIIDDETTVMVESLDNPAVASIQQANLEIIAKANNVNLGKSERVLEESVKRANNYAVVCGVAKPSIKDRINKKKKKFRYLTKAERRENTRKEKTKNKGRKN